MRAFVAVVFALLVSCLLVRVVALAPHHAGLRRRVARLRKWAAGATSVAGGIGFWKYPEAWTYGDLHLASQAAVATLVVADVALVGLIVVRAVHAQRQPYVLRGVGSSIGALVVVSGALAVVRTSPSCDVLHPWTEPVMSVQRQDPGTVIKAEAKGPIRPALPPPLTVTPPAPAPSLGPPRAIRLPPIVPGHQPEPTSEPFGGCLSRSHPD